MRLRLRRRVYWWWNMEPCDRLWWMRNYLGLQIMSHREALYK